MMRFLSILVWLMVGLQIALLGVSGGSDPIIWANVAITLAAAVYVTTVAGDR